MELEDFIPETRTVDLPGGPVEISPVTVRKFPAFSAAVKPVMEFAMAGRFLAALSEHPEAMIDTVVVGSDIPRDRVEALRPDHFIALAQAVIEVNADFFVRRLLLADQAAGAAMAALLARLVPDGALPSPGSANADTA